MSTVSESARVAVIIEDDVDVQTLLDEVFRAAGFETVLAGSAPEGIAAVVAHRPVITTLDVNLPGMDGFEAARRIREVSTTFIIMLSALSEEPDVVLGLSAGADDYLVKPVRPRELRARIEAVMRRPRFEAPPVPGSPSGGATMPSPAAGLQTHRDLSLDPDTHTVLVGGGEVELTPTEFDLLATLLDSGRRVRSKAELALVLRGDTVGGVSDYVGEPDKRTVEAHMTNLRRKLGDTPADPRFIETVRGVGYRLTSADLPTG
ncbi:response regulator transcription factor [Microbacterium sp. OVT16B]|uniref:response regulator transcription factor n=1 Tax=Microbacterium sp. OVT16B TaxID=2862682 RepID=UPI001CBB85E5|nr:response regulator transcription factor [Microbacterium sp. OVT16B]